MTTDASLTGESISVALCTHNGAAHIEAQLRSILSQSHAIDEIVVSDDASQDETLTVVRSVLDEPVPFRVTVLENDPPLGVTANFEHAIRATSGDIVILSDQDDVWHRNRVASAIGSFDADDELQLLFSDAALVDASGSSLGLALFEALEITSDDLARLRCGRAFETFLKRNLATGATLAFRRTLLDDALPFPRTWVHDEWLAILAASREQVGASAEQAIDYRQHSSNQIGVAEPTVGRKIRRVLSPRGDRNRGLAERSNVLLDRLVANGAGESALRLAQGKASIEEFRASLSANRLKRIIPVLRRAVTGDYERYCSRGRMDIVRDLLQPA